MMAESPAISDRPALQTMATRRRRYRQRSQEEIEILELARELDWLARRYNRFSKDLNTLRNRVKFQLSSPKAKRDIVVKCLRKSQLLFDLDEIIAETYLDRFSVTTALGNLIQENVVEQVNRKGNPPRITASGRPTDRIYYRLSLRPLTD